MNTLGSLQVSLVLLSSFHCLFILFGIAFVCVWELCVYDVSIMVAKLVAIWNRI